jgi:phosphoesterase RecJ-like protein
VPRNLKWLPHTRTFVQKLRKDARFALTVVVDCGDARLLGPDFPPLEVTGPLLVLDHHASGRPFGDLFVCDPEASSVGVLVARIAVELGWPISEAAGKGLFVSLVTDTGSFRYANTNAEAFRIAADLVDRGVVDPWTVSERLSEQGSVPRLRLLAKVLETIELALDGRVAFLSVTEEMVKASGASWEDTDGLVNYARALKGVDCGVLISPAKRGGTRVSMRSKGRFIDAGRCAWRSAAAVTRERPVARCPRRICRPPSRRSTTRWRQRWRPPRRRRELHRLPVWPMSRPRQRHMGRSRAAHVCGRRRRR